MPGPQNVGAPFPGFSMDHFHYGLQMGMDEHGTSQHPWDSPYQDPYAMGINPAGPPGMGSMPGPGMGVGPQGPIDSAPFGGFGGLAGDTQGGQQGPQMPQGVGWPGQPDPSQPPGPSPTGVWGDQDLINDPDYADAAQSAHPKWNRFLQYMNTPQARDSMMLGVIMSQMGTNPQAAMQMALQFKEHVDQRNWQAQQNEMQREAMLQRGQLAKVDARAGKLRAQALQNGIDISGLGPLDESNLDYGEAYVQKQAAEKKSADATQKQSDNVTKDKRALLNGTFKHEVDATKYTDPNSKDYDPTFKNAYTQASAVRQQRDDDTKQREALLDRLRRAEERFTRLKATNLEGKLTDVQKASFRANMAKASELLKSAASANKTADQYEIFGDDWPAAAKMYTEHSKNAKQNNVEGLNLLNKMISNPAGNYENEFEGLKSADDSTVDETGTVEDTSIPPEVAALLKKYPGTQISLPAGVIKQGAMTPSATSDAALAKENARRAKLGLPPKE